MATPGDFANIPIVDISGLRTGDVAARARVAQALGAAAREVGFLYVTGHGLDPALIDGLLAASERFFALPLAEKMKVYIGNSTNHRGYVPEGEEGFYGNPADIKEAYDLSIDLPAEDPDYVAGNPFLGPNQWPDLPGFAAAVSAYYQAIFALGLDLLDGFAIALGEEPAVFRSHVTKPPSQLRLVHYPFNPAAEDRLGIGAHTDYEVFTLLLATKPGLEVMNGAGTWIDAPPVPGAFVVNVGDMLETWTNGEFIATSHRVRKVKEERYSFPLFFNVDYHTHVAPLPRFVKDGQAARVGLSAGEHLFAQTAQTFNYLRRKLEAGEIKLPDGALGLSSFGQEARHKTA
jgi:isopenicillin N synthase-like dioxygenase